MSGGEEPGREPVEVMGRRPRQPGSEGGFNGLVDLHSHVLSGFDDGASGPEQSLRMVRAAWQGGITDIVATPHLNLDTGGITPASIAASVDELNQVLRGEGLEVRIHVGAEVRMSATLARPEELPWPLEQLTVGGKGVYLLVDLPSAEYLLPSDEAFFRLQLAGVNPILAHPERNRMAGEDLAKLASLRDRGVALQVNAGSLLGSYGKKVKGLAWKILEEGLAQLVATDAHHPANGSLDLCGVGRSIASRLGEENALLLVRENPRRVLEGRPLEQPTPRPRRRFGRSRG